jgi:nucleotidyltransferase substrate binding protein (TIGR01987 family)
MDPDIRWHQRFSNYRKALEKLEDAIELLRQKTAASTQKLSDTRDIELLKEGLIQRFEYTHESGWNVMEDYAIYQGNNSIKGSRDATREAFKMNLISDGEVWMKMIGSRNETSHTYNEDIAEEIYEDIIKHYFPRLKEFASTMEALHSGGQKDLFSGEV